MRSRLALGRSTHAGGPGIGPNHRSILALTAPRGQRHTYAEGERSKLRQGNTEKDGIKRERMREYAELKKRKVLA